MVSCELLEASRSTRTSTKFTLPRHGAGGGGWGPLVESWNCLRAVPQLRFECLDRRRSPLASRRPARMKSGAHMPLSAALLIVAASACFTSVDVTVKYLSQRYPVPLL